MATYRLHVVSSLEADPPTVWAHAASMEGINAELWPLRMTGPSGIRLDEAPLGPHVFRSVILLFRVLPLDLHTVGLVEVTAGAGFHERSSSLLEARWEHRRRLTPRAGGTMIEDEVTFAPRLFGFLLRQVVARAFARRHRFLRRRFGGDGTPVEVRVQRLGDAGAGEL